MPSLSGEDHLELRYPLLQAEDFDAGNVHVTTITTAFMSYVDGIEHGSYLVFSDVDLTGVRRIGIRIQPNGVGGSIALRQGGPEGTVVGRMDIPPGIFHGSVDGWQELVMPVSGAAGIADLYIGFENAESEGNLFHVDWLRFYNH